MSDELGAAGAAATAGLAAGAIEGAGHSRAGHGPCPNCGADLAGGNYCATCGQPAHISRTLHDLLHDFLHSFLHFDTKAWRTLPMLVGRPGTLTYAYIHGKRARFISPLAMFLFTLFVMFFVFSLGAQQSIGSVNADGEIVSAPGVEMRMQADEDYTGPPRTLQESIIESLDNGDLDIDLGNEKLDKKIEAKLRNIDFLLYKMQQTVYKFAFLLVPITLPFIALLFLWKRGVTLFDHVAFSLYSLSFMSMLAIALVLIGRLGDAVTWLAVPADQLINLAIFFAPPAHMFFHLKGTYALGWFSAAWRSVLLLVFAGISLAIFFLIVLMAGLLG